MIAGPFEGEGGSAEMGLRELFDNFDSDNDGALAQGEMERLAQTLANPQNWRSMQNMQNREPIQPFGQSYGAVMNWVPT